MTQRDVIVVFTALNGHTGNNVCPAVTIEGEIAVKSFILLMWMLF